MLLEDLWYPSESDEPIEWFCFSTSMLPPLTVAEFAVAQHISSEVLIEEKK
ncbi:MAG: hypothetical protein R2822_24605 [Spirosomataceae bacterium]